MSKKQDKIQLNLEEKSDEKNDVLMFEKSDTKQPSMLSSSSTIRKVNSSPLLDSDLAKKFTESFTQQYREACESADTHTMRDERLEDRLGGQRRIYRFKRYFTAIYISFLPILITGFETFSSSKNIQSCTQNGQEILLGRCITCNKNSIQYDINIGYNVLVYIFWVIVVAQYYLFFYCTLKKSKMIMSLFSFQIKVKATFIQALRSHWVGFFFYTVLLVLAVVFNKIVRMYAGQDSSSIECGGVETKLILQGDDYTPAQYATSLILTVLFSLDSYNLILNLALQPAHSYFTAQRIFHSSFSSDVAYILQQISKINKEITYYQFYTLLDETAISAGTTVTKLPFINDQISHAILLVIVYRINKERLYLAVK